MHWISHGSESSRPISQTVFSLEPRHSFLITLNYCDDDDDDDVDDVDDGDDDEDDDDDASAAAKMLRRCVRFRGFKLLACSALCQSVNL